MKRIGALALTALIVVFAIAEPVLAQPRRLVTIASGWVVGVYYPLAGAMSSIAYNAKGLNIRATVEASGASVANAQLIGAGDADFALLQNDIAFYAFNGATLPAFKGKPVKNMGGIFTIYPELVHIVPRRPGREVDARLKGKRVVGPQGSGTSQNALHTLEVYGIRSRPWQDRAHRRGRRADQLKTGASTSRLYDRARIGVILDTSFRARCDGADRRRPRRCAAEQYPF